jgi:hypothetical protein
VIPSPKAVPMQLGNKASYNGIDSFGERTGFLSISGSSNCENENDATSPPLLAVRVVGGGKVSGPAIPAL